MEERSIDKAPSASLDMMALNKMVVNARSIVKTAKTHLINKLLRNVTELKNKKGSEQQKEKNLKKAQRFLEEVDSIRTLKDDKIFKYALANVSKFEEVAKSTASPAARAMARLADHRFIQQAVQKFRAEQSDWRDLAAFMLMKQTGRKFKTAKQIEKAKGKKGRKKDVEKVNLAENIRASKVMTDVYTQGLFREDNFQKAKVAIEEDSKGELNFLQKRRLKIANDRKEKQQKKIESSKNANEKKDNVKEKSDLSQSKKLSISQSNGGNTKVKQKMSDDDSRDCEIDEDSETNESEEESEESGDESKVLSSKKTNNNSKAFISKSKKAGLEEQKMSDSEDESSDDDDEEEGDLETSEDSESEEKSLENEDSEGQDDIQPVTPAVLKKDCKQKNLESKSKKSSEKGTAKTNKKETIEPPNSNKRLKKELVEPLDSKKSNKKDYVVPLGSKKQFPMNTECVVKQLNIGLVSSEEDNDEQEVDSTVEEAKQSKKGKKGKSVPTFLTEGMPKKMPKDSFFEGGDVDSESDEESEKDDSEKDAGDKSDGDDNDILGHRGKIKSMIYSQGGRGVGRGRGGRGGGRGGGSNNEGGFKFGGRGGKQGKKSGRGGGGGDNSGPFLFGSKEVMYKRRNQSIITEEGKTKLVTERKEEPKPKLHPSWEASRKRKAEQSGGIKAFAGKKINFDDD